MIQIHFKHAILIGAVVLAIALMSGTSNPTQQGQKEVMMVQQVGTLYIAVFYPDKPAEKFDLENRLIGPAKNMKNGEMIKSKLQELYNQGWELAGTNGEANIQTYVLTRQR